MKKITYRELLNMIEEETNPDVVYFGGDSFKWNGFSYLNNIKRLSNILSGGANDFELVNHLYISYQDEVLDKKEKEYLSNLIKPFKKYVISITKIDYYGQDRIEIRYKDFEDRKYPHIQSVIPLPTFRKNSMYTGMKIEQPYTLEELGL